MASLTAIIGLVVLGSPQAHADGMNAQAAPMPAGEAGTKAMTNDRETVEQRITKLHADLKITAAEEPKWAMVAQAMRDNAAAMESLVATKRAQAGQDMTALDDLMTYQTFAQAHVDGLKKLTVAFKSLYESMSDADKKNADAVFQASSHEATSSHS